MPAKRQSESATRARWLLATFAGLALVLALAGVSGALAYSVARRTSEIGVRLALAAEHRDIVRLVVAQGMRPCSPVLPSAAPSPSACRVDVEHAVRGPASPSADLRQRACRRHARRRAGVLSPRAPRAARRSRDCIARRVGSKDQPTIDTSSSPSRAGLPMTSISVILPFAIVNRSARTSRPPGATTTPMAPSTRAGCVSRARCP